MGYFELCFDYFLFFILKNRKYGILKKYILIVFIYFFKK